MLLASTVLVLGMGLPTTPSYIIAAAIGVPQSDSATAAWTCCRRTSSSSTSRCSPTRRRRSPPPPSPPRPSPGPARRITALHATRFGIAGFTVGFAFIYDPGIMLRGGLAEILLATAMQVAALITITAAYAGYLAAPIGLAARALLGAAGLAAAFLHLLSAPWRLAVAVGALALVHTVGRAGTRRGRVA